MTIALEPFIKTIQNLTSSKEIWIALSGGLDSSVLLDLCVRAFGGKPEYKLGVVHVHEGLSPDADAWVIFCEKLCEKYKIKYQALKIHVETKNQSNLEEAARMGRRKAWENFFQNHAQDMALLLGHHQADQAETVLMRLCRGTGVLGLSAMLPKSKLGKIALIRPLLSYPKEALEAYAQTQKLSWIEDKMNQDLRFDRNFIRHQIMPLLKTRWPDIAAQMSQTAVLCALSAETLETQAHDDLDKILIQSRNTLSMKQLVQLSTARSREVVRLWIKKQGFKLPGLDKIERLFQEVIFARADAKPLMKVANYAFRRYQDELYVVDSSSRDLFKGSSLNKNSILWDWYKLLYLSEKCYLEAKINTTGIGISLEKIKNKPLEVRFRREGERCKLPGRNHSTSLKKLLQEYHVPPWLRDDTPILYLEGEIIAIVGYWIADYYRAKEKEQKIEVIFHIQ